MRSLMERLEESVAPKDVELLRRLFVSFLLILLFWGAWAVVTRVIG